MNISNIYVDSSVALKDLDFSDSREKIRVDPDIAKALIQQMEDDAHLFQRLNINDYSLLLGIHRFKSKEEATHIRRVSPNINQFIKNSFKFKDQISNLESIRCLKPFISILNAQQPLLKSLPSFGTQSTLNDKVLGHRQSLVQYSTSEIMRPPIPFYETHDGGILSSDGKCLYFIGIIDTLTLFGPKKQMEYTLKSLRYGNKTISCIPPHAYGERFISFMKTLFDTKYIPKFILSLGTLNELMSRIKLF